MYTNHRHYTLLFFALAAIVVSSIGYFFLYRSIQSQSISAQESLRMLALEDQKKQQEGDSASIYAKTAEERARLEAAVLSEEKAVDFITAIEKIGAETGTRIELSAIADEKTSGEEKLGYFKAHVNARGSWANVMRTLALIENMPYGISFDSVRVTEVADMGVATKDKKTSAKTWELTLDIRALTTKK